MKYELRQGDVLDELRKIPDNSIDAILGDPPSAISMMDLSWDSDKGGREQWIAWMTEVCAECKRVLKPGGFHVFWALPRTSHWTATAMENAGLEISGKLYHIFGSSMPHGVNIAKALDAAAGVIPTEIIGQSTGQGYSSLAEKVHESGARPYVKGLPAEHTDRNIYAPVTELAKKYMGWNSALKASLEEYIVGRKPLIGTYVENITTYGTGAYNIGATRVGVESEDAKGRIKRWTPTVLFSHTPECVYLGTMQVKSSSRPTIASPTALGQGSGWNQHANRPVEHPGHADTNGEETVERWACPPECSVRILEMQSGKNKGGTYRPPTARKRERYFESKGEHASTSNAPDNYGDEGSATRYFPIFPPDDDVLWRYLPKPSVAEANKGLPRGMRNKHPTKKGISLFYWILTLICPPGGVVLDPFCGSGPTLVAGLEAGFDVIGIDADPESIAVARARAEHTLKEIAAATHTLF